MLAKTNRLNLTTQYQVLSQKGKRKTFPLFNVLCFIDQKGCPPQVAIVVGNKVSGLSTQRHRAKRLLTEIIRPLIPVLPKGLKLCLFAKKEISGKNFWEIKKEMEKAIKTIEP